MEKPPAAEAYKQQHEQKPVREGRQGQPEVMHEATPPPLGEGLPLHPWGRGYPSTPEGEEKGLPRGEREGATPGGERGLPMGERRRGYP